MGIFSKSKDFENREYNNIFQLSNIPAFKQYYEEYIAEWKSIYFGFKPDWHTIKTPTIANPYHSRRAGFVNIAKVVCSEISNLIWNEKCQINISTADENKSEILNSYLQNVLCENNFDVNFRKLIEKSFALGGGCVKINPIQKDNGEGIEWSVFLDYLQADYIVPLSWDNKFVNSAVFINRTAKKGKYYTRLEFHEKNNNEIHIENKLFVSENQNLLGRQTVLESVYPDLTANVEIKPVNTALFSYFSPNIANNIDDCSPLGISIFANAIDTIKAIDVCFDALQQEIILGRKRIIVPASAIRSVRDSKGNEHRYFNANDSVYEAMFCDDVNNLKIQDNSVELRIDEIKNALNTLLNLLCVQIGVNVGTFSFDEAKGIKTATEIVSENSKTFRFIKTLEQPIEYSLKNIIDGILTVAVLYDVKYEGYSVADLIAAGYDLKVKFDDSIIEDKTAEMNRAVMLVQNNLLSKKKFMLDYLGYTEKQAKAEIEAINSEADKVPSMDF